MHIFAQENRKYLQVKVIIFPIDFLPILPDRKLFEKFLTSKLLRT